MQEASAASVGSSRTEPESSYVPQAMYSDLFDWLVRIVNQRSGGGSLASSHFIGVLDIFGFEILASNSFEQVTFGRQLAVESSGCATSRLL